MQHEKNIPVSTFSKVKDIFSKEKKSEERSHDSPSEPRLVILE